MALLNGNRALTIAAQKVKAVIPPFGVLISKWSKYAISWKKWLKMFLRPCLKVLETRVFHSGRVFKIGFLRAENVIFTPFCIKNIQML